ncbi:hypothetical protein [uncultured Roseobacter sp.]|nr:hypothetical protein [uncultured Roseobacter sp.]
MSDAMIDLLFWIVVFVALFFLFRRMQAAKKNKNKDRDQND